MRNTLLTIDNLSIYAFPCVGMWLQLFVSLSLTAYCTMASTWQ